MARGGGQYCIMCVCVCVCVCVRGVVCCGLKRERTIICGFPSGRVLDVAFAIISLDTVEDAAGPAFRVHAHEDFGVQVASGHSCLRCVSLNPHQ